MNDDTRRLDLAVFKSALDAAGFKIPQLAREANISERYIRDALAGLIPGEGARQRIASALSVSEGLLWPPLPQQFAGDLFDSFFGRRNVSPRSAHDGTAGGADPQSVPLHDETPVHALLCIKAARVWCTGYELQFLGGDWIVEPARVAALKHDAEHFRLLKFTSKEELEQLLTAAKARRAELVEKANELGLHILADGAFTIPPGARGEGRG